MKYLKVWTDFEGALSPLKDDEIGRLFLHMIHYAKTGEEPSAFVGNEAFIWPAAKRDIDVAAEKAEKMRENGSKGGIAKSKNNQMIANAGKSYQIVANDSKTYQNEANAGYKTRQDMTRHDMTQQDSKRRFTPPTLQEVTDYCQSRNNGVDPQRFIDFYASKGWMVGKNAMKDWKACVRTWEGRDKGQKKVIAQDFQQRDYSDVNDQMMNDLARDMEAFRKEVG